MDRDRFPTTARYLDALPDGIRSYPQCEVKAAILLAQMNTRPIPEALLADFPREVIELAKDPPPVSAWVSEVVSMTITVAIRDLHFPPGQGDAEYEAWTYERNRRLLGSRIYRPVFLLISPERLLRFANMRWNRIRRGSSLEVLEQSKGFAKVQSRYPRNLHEGSVAIGMRGAMRAVTELAGGKNVRVHVPEVGETQTTFDIEYD